MNANPIKVHLDIIHKGTLVNSYEHDDELTVLRMFKECVIHEKVRGNKARWHKEPYQDLIKVTLTWPNSMPEHKYKYTFWGVCEDRR